MFIYLQSILRNQRCKQDILCTPRKTQRFNQSLVMKNFFVNGFFIMKLDSHGKLLFRLWKSLFDFFSGVFICIYFYFFCSVRIWDLAIFVPNFIFFLFMLVRFNRARLKLRATSSPIFATFFSLVSVNNLLVFFKLRVDLLFLGGAQCSYKFDSLHSFNDCECLFSCRRLCR